MKRKVLGVGGDKGGIGKSTTSQGVAEAAPDTRIFEFETSHRLIGLRDRVTHFPAVVTSEDVEASGGLAQRERFDLLLNAISEATVPVVVDIGANTTAATFEAIGEVAAELAALHVEIGIVIVSTADPAAIATAGALLESVRPWASSRFFVENQMYGPIAERVLRDVAGDAKTTILARHVVDPDAQPIINAGGLCSIARLDPAALNTRFGLMKGLRVMRDLQRFRLAVMRAVEPSAEWLVS